MKKLKLFTILSVVILTLVHATQVHALRSQTVPINANGTFFFPLSVDTFGVASSTELRSPSGTISTLWDLQGNKYVTSTGGTPATPIGGIQYNESNAFAASTTLTFTTTTKTLVLFGIVSSSEIRSPSSTVTTMNFTNASGTNVDLTGQVTLDDNQKICFGTGNDGCISYNGTNLVIDPEEVGTGDLVVGDGEAGRDYDITFDGENSDGTLRWSEDEDYWWSGDDIRVADFSTGFGSMGIGTSPSTDIGINLNKILTNVTGYGGDFQAHNRQDSTTSTYTAVGVRTQANVGTGVTTRGSATGGQFSARLNGWLGGSVVTSGEILGGRFAADTSGEVDNFTYPNFTGGRFIVQLGSTSNNATVTTAYASDYQMNLQAVSSTFANARFINLNAMGGFGGFSTITNFDAIYVGDMSNVSTTEARPSIFTIEPQDGAFKGGNKFNMVWEGNDFNEGHVVLNDAHIWGASSSLRIKTGSYPSSSNDYSFEVSTSTVFASGTLKLANGYINSTGTIPTLSACGTSPSIVGTNSWGTITEGSIATGCTMTFATPRWTNPPACVVTSESALAFTYTVTSSTLAITNVGALSDTKVDYHCGGLD